MQEIVIFNICNQRRKRQLFNSPVRIEMLDTPYGGAYTMEQINMRRKAEILQYAPNKQSSQTNSATKTQKYALIVNAPPRLNNNKVVSGNPCPSDNLIPVPTSSSDVPGPIQYLIYDKNVTLYNDINPISTRAYSEGVISNKKSFDYNFSENSLISGDSTDKSIVSIYFNIVPKSVNITLVIPIGIYFNGDISTYIQAPNTQLEISIININVELYYNDTLISNIELPDIINLKIQVTNTNSKINIFKYIKTITTTLIASIDTNNVYDIKISYKKVSGTRNLSNENVKLIANMTTSTNIISNNVTITSFSPSPNTYNKTAVSYT
jgi:hypothetical protein